MTQLSNLLRSRMALVMAATVLGCLLPASAGAAPRIETRTFMAVDSHERGLSFRLVGVDPASIRRARLVSGRRVVAVPLATARRGARRRALRLSLSIFGGDRRAKGRRPARRARLRLGIVVSPRDSDTGLFDPPPARGGPPATENPSVAGGASDARTPPPDRSGASPGRRDGRANPLAGMRLHVEADSPANRQADAWRVSRPLDAAHLDRIAAEPQAVWLGEWSGDVRSAVDQRVSAAVGDGRVPVLVAYNIPLRDCGNHSAGGVASTQAYRTWIRELAAGIGSRPAIVVLEPDALAGLDCLSSDDRVTRVSLLEDAVSVLTAHESVATYVDAGHSAWQSASVIASRLNSIGIARADGFALNVSNFRATGEEVTYGATISQLTGGEHFVIDTSRNGAAAASKEWCNPDGRALGRAPTTDTGQPLVDAYLWIKRPGESDGTCNGGPPSGTWWPEYALGLSQRAR